MERDATTGSDGGHPRPWSRAEWIALATLYLASLAVRLLALTSPPHGDEALHFIVARDLGRTPANVLAVDIEGVTELAPFLWQRPLFSLVYAPFAQLGFPAYRLGHILVSGLLPVLAAGLLRDRGVDPVLTWGGAGVLVGYPLYVEWGVRVFPDGPMAVLFLAALWMLTRKRHAVAVGLLVASVWVKEVAIVGAVPVIVWMIVEARRDPSRDPVWSRPAGGAALIGGFTAAAMAPLAIATLVLPGRFPGWAEPILLLDHVDGLFLTAAAIPVLLLGLRWRRSRLLAGLALWHGAFYMAYRVVLGRGLSVWYRILPGALSLVGTAIAVDTWWRRPGSDRRLPAVAVGVVAGILVIQAVAPIPQYGSTAERIGEMHDGRDVDVLVARLDATERQDLLLVDVGWYYVYWPFSDIAGRVRHAETANLEEPGSLDPEVRNASATVVHPEDSPSNREFRDRWRDCVAWRTDDYLVIHGRDCEPGSSSQTF